MTWKSWPNFFKFQSMSILAIYCNRWQETTANKNLLKNTAKPSWYWHLRDRALSLLYRGVVYFTEVGCVQNLVLLSLHNGHYFFPFFRRAKASVEPARNARHTWWGKAQKKKIIIIFFLCLSLSCVSGILSCFMLALAHLKNAKN